MRVWPKFTIPTNSLDANFALHMTSPHYGFGLELVLGMRMI